jgi:hypothetical protein
MRWLSFAALMGRVLDTASSFSACFAAFRFALIDAA